ncbi:hypothetical protein BTURTLESOX_259 [bacterium endosymbiont of Bathymodiolus sp. 5 South]|nr:hypothetical protein BTURTLESOX_259 [bacterium endosymbiont of Bathymodiolus sp. 5 South]
MIVPIYAKVSCNNSNTNFVLNAEVYLVRFFYYLFTAFLNS